MNEVLKDMYSLTNKFMAENNALGPNEALSQANTSGIRPLEYNVLVAPNEVAEKTTGGLYIPDQQKEREQYAQTEGVLVAMSPLAFNYEAGAPKPELGQRVMFSSYQATEARGVDGRIYWLMKDKAISAVVEGRKDE